VTLAMRLSRNAFDVAARTVIGFAMLDKLSYLLFAQAGGQLLFHLIRRVSAHSSTSTLLSTTRHADETAS
jgi:hypothetical protein